MNPIIWYIEERITELEKEIEELWPQFMVNEMIIDELQAVLNKIKEYANN